MGSAIEQVINITRDDHQEVMLEEISMIAARGRAIAGVLSNEDAAEAMDPEAVQLMAYDLLLKFEEIMEGLEECCRK